MQHNQTYFSVVIPVYGCEKCLFELYKRLKITLEQITNEFEIILVNDASPDGSIEIINKLANLDQRVKGVILSRNFGQHYAITAGLDISSGNWIIVMDCDLQDQPEEILKLYEEASKGFDIVLGRRAIRKDSFLKRLSSKFFYKTFSYLTDTNQDGTIANFGIYNRKIIDTIIGMRENLRFFPTMVKWVGYRVSSIDIDHNSRGSGKSGYSLKKLIKLAIDVILAFSDKPLKITVKLGIYISLFSFIYAVYIVIRALLGIQNLLGWSSLIVSIWFFSGIMIFIMGIIGIYIGKIFDEVKKRPLYIVDRYINRGN